MLCLTLECLAELDEEKRWLVTMASFVMPPPPTVGVRRVEDDVPKGTCFGCCRRCTLIVNGVIGRRRADCCRRVEEESVEEDGVEEEGVEEEGVEEE